MAENDDDLMSGPLSARLVSTKGPVRMKAYEELATVFTQAEEDTASVFREHGFLKIIKFNQSKINFNNEIK